jgi:FkbM family methyltransferase
MLNRLKKWTNELLGKFDAQLIRRPSLSLDIKQGKYRWLQERNINTVIDVGANTGQFAELIREILPSAMIYSFEPLESCFKELTVKGASLMPMQSFNIALGDKAATVMMNRNEFTPSSSLLKMGQKHLQAFPFTERVTNERITIRTLDDFSSQLTLKSPVLAKLDVQGYELKVLKGARKTLPRIDILILETSFVELYKGQPLFDEIYQHLRSNHFRYIGSFGQIPHPIDGTILQSDSIFVNSRMRGTGLRR